MTLEKNSADLINAIYSLHFVSPKDYSKVWAKVTNAIKHGGYFVGNFIGVKDSWNCSSFEFTILGKVKIQNMFKDFELLYFEETEKDSQTVLGHNKHWHIYSVIAKKK